MMEPSKKKMKLSLKKTKENAERFEFLNDVEFGEVCQPFQPKNTSYSTKWAVSNFESWKKKRNDSTKTSEKIPDDIFLRSAKDIDKWLAHYAVETRNYKGEPYPPKTLYQLICGLSRHAKVINPECPNFMDRNNPAFRRLWTSVDNVCRSLRANGIGAESKHTALITKEEENKLWEANALSLQSPKALLRTVFFTVGKFCCLRGGEEHRNLTISQFERLTDPHRYVYTENASKNRPGGVSQLRVENKKVTVVAVPSAGDRCPVFILDVYFSKLPAEAFRNDIFYVRPLEKVTKENLWFSAVPIGKNTLSTIVKTTCEEAGIVGKTNHSLRATGASTMFAAGVPERIIQEVTGHRSIEALHSYERTSTEQLGNVAEVLAAKENKQFDWNLKPEPKLPAREALTDRNMGGYTFLNCTVTVVQSAPLPSCNECLLKHLEPSSVLNPELS